MKFQIQFPAFNRSFSAQLLIIFCLSGWALPSHAQIRSHLQPTLKSWKLPAAELELHCLNEACKKNQAYSWEVKNWILENLRLVPDFLRRGIPALSKISWIEQGKSEPVQGIAYGNSNYIILQTSRDFPLHTMMTHEIAHLFEVHNPRLVYDFTSLRFHKKEFKDNVNELSLYIYGLTKDLAYGEAPKFTKELTRKIVSMKLPHRGPFDYQAMLSNEYWAVSVELYDTFKRKNQMDQLLDHLTIEEIEFLDKLFGSN